MKYLLLPFAFIYNVVTTVRNFLYDHKILFFTPQQFDVYTIVVGNLSVGGTGKTPFIEYLIRFLHTKYKVATLSRGYGRITKGVIIANKKNATAANIGDEPMQFFTKFYPKIYVVVGEERTIAIPHLLSKHAETQIVLLDDAFQHRKVKPDLNILLTDYHHLFFKDHLLPMGRLRESRRGAKRANILIVTKCPDDISYKMEYIRQKAKKYLSIKSKFVYFTGIKYGTPTPMSEKQRPFDFSNKIVLVTGIANAVPIKKHVAENYSLAQHLEFADHYQYKNEDFVKINASCEKITDLRKCILTTEKDIMKWMDDDVQKYLGDLPVFYLPIETYFIENEASFQKMVLKGLK